MSANVAQNTAKTVRNQPKVAYSQKRSVFQDAHVGSLTKLRDQINLHSHYPDIQAACLCVLRKSRLDGVSPLVELKGHAIMQKGYRKNCLALES